MPLFTTKGRIPRSTYWIFSLTYAGIAIVAMVMDYALGTFDQDTGIGVLSGILVLVGFFPQVCVMIKRCHDRDRSGWFLLLGFIPFLNLWVAIELAFLRGTLGRNNYGPDPIGE